MQVPPPKTPVTTSAPTLPAEARGAADLKSMRSSEFRPRRVLWPGLLGAALIGAGVAALSVSNYYDDRTVGARVDATVAAAASTVKDGVDDLRSAASGAAQGTADAADRVAGTMGDAAITAAVKTALAADPSLSAVHIDVTTTHGSVRLDGPAPDTKSRARAEVLAMAPKGVLAVDNRLVVPPARTPNSAVIAATPAAPVPATPAPDTSPAAKPADTAQRAEPLAVTEVPTTPAPVTAGTPAAQ